MKPTVLFTALASCVVLACATGTYAPSESKSSQNDGKTDSGATNDNPNPTCDGTLCGGDCVDTASDANNCGGCGIACDVTQTCTGGQCTSTATSNAPPQGACSHSLCSAGDSLDEGCDTLGCSIVICDPGYLDDEFCCASQWDSTCIDEVTQYCAPYSCN